MPKKDESNLTIQKSQNNISYRKGGILEKLLKGNNDTRLIQKDQLTE